MGSYCSQIVRNARDRRARPASAFPAKLASSTRHLLELASSGQPLQRSPRSCRPSRTTRGHSRGRISRQILQREEERRMDAADQWSAQKTVPSIVFVLAPSIAVGMLVIWSIRMQRARRAWYLELMQRQRAGVATGSGSGINPLDKPGMHAVWLETSWDEKHHSTEEEKEEEDVGSGHDRGKRRKSSSSYQSYVTERYSWQTILPVSLAEPAKKDGLSDVSVMIRMPISNGSTNDSNLHKDVTDNELQIATLRLRPPLLPAPSGSTAAA